ncbi:MAG: hypothetical protein JO293_06795 [Candidatus Eremiobacteraeota bacterium]|nr:hypothetical protein [Candidatus Eremiobacteraeota bacterium]MBV8223053.1 hypothetical protein [Candidatus Eremiobacteraeota bacterium]
MRTSWGILGALAILGCAGCGTAPHTSPPPRGAPPIAGTLYVVHLAARDAAAQRIEVLRNGSIVRHSAPPGLLIARDRPAVSISTKVVYADGHLCQPMAISPHGTYVACMRDDGYGTISLYRRSNPLRTLHDTGERVSVDNHQMIGFVSDERLAVAGDDMSCPAYYRSDAQVWSAQPRSRLFVVDAQSGRTIRSGECVHGLVTGDGAIAVVGHDQAEDPQYSLDGVHWIKGLPVAVDGDGNVLSISSSNDLVDGSDRVIAHDVVDAIWTR